MDGHEFDNLVGRLGGVASRRAAIAGVVGVSQVGPATATRKQRGAAGTAACNDQACVAENGVPDWIQGRLPNWRRRRRRLHG